MIGEGFGRKSISLLKNIWIGEPGLKRNEITSIREGLWTKEELISLKHLDWGTWTKEERSDVGGASD